MSARHILGVIFLIDEDGTGLEPAMLLDESQFICHQGLNHLGH